MPWGNRTGPMGMGPMTGRGAGYCAGYPALGYAQPVSGRYFGGAPYYGRMAFANPVWHYGFRRPFNFVGAGFGRRGGGRWFGRGRGWGRGRFAY